MTMIPSQARKDPNDSFDYAHAFSFALDRIDSSRNKTIDFIKSLQNWYETRRFLSEKQKAALMKILKNLDYFKEDPADYY